METEALIDQRAFSELVSAVQTKAGGNYQDIDTIYRDMSRLVIALLHTTDTATLGEIYHRLWKGQPNIRAMKACERAWVERHGKAFPPPKD
jgi:hypothetical protein